MRRIFPPYEIRASESRITFLLSFVLISLIKPTAKLGFFFPQALNLETRTQGSLLLTFPIHSRFGKFSLPIWYTVQRSNEISSLTLSSFVCSINLVYHDVFTAGDGQWWRRFFSVRSFKRGLVPFLSFVYWCSCLWVRKYMCSNM